MIEFLYYYLYLLLLVLLLVVEVVLFKLKIDFYIVLMSVLIDSKLYVTNFIIISKEKNQI